MVVVVVVATATVVVLVAFEPLGAQATITRASTINGVRRISKT